MLPVLAPFVVGVCAPCSITSPGGVYLVPDGHPCFFEAQACLRLSVVCDRPKDWTILARADSPSVYEKERFYVQPRTAASSILMQLAKNNVYLMETTVDYESALRVVSVGGKRLTCGGSLSEDSLALQNFTVVGASRSGNKADDGYGVALVLTVLTLLVFVVAVVCNRMLHLRSWAIGRSAVAVAGMILSAAVTFGVVLWIGA